MKKYFTPNFRIQKISLLSFVFLLTIGMFTSSVFGQTSSKTFDFNGSANDGVAVLKWRASNPQPGDYFEIEKRTETEMFRVMGKYEVAKSPEETGYSVYDISPANGINYYRLKSTNAAGKVSYGKTISVTFNTHHFQIIRIYPTPFFDKIAIVVETDRDSDFNVKLTDNKGKTFRSEKSKVKKGREILVLRDLGGLLNGVYYVELSDGETAQMKIIIK